MATIRLFEGAAHAASYAAFRPSYPPSVLEAISTFITSHSGSGFNTAVDVACGSGQSTFFLTQLFQRVVGVDISQAQVDNARAKSKEKPIPEGKEIEFKVGSSDNIPVDSSSVDLVSCAQAWHWFEPNGFYREAERVLKPTGTLAVYGYGNVEVHDERCNHLVSDFYRKLKEGGYWHEKRKHIDNKYQAVTFTSPFLKTERKDLTMACQMNLAHFTGYVSTWSGYCNFNDQHPGNTALHNLQEGLRNILQPQNTQQEDTKENLCLDVSFPVFIILGQKCVVS